MDRERRDFIAAATMAGAVTGMGASAAPGTGV
ncbi:MAG: twin-arginine translocation signal domain-containing protein, partial [Steroidobacteraceae bacterium]